MLPYVPSIEDGKLTGKSHENPYVWIPCGISIGSPVLHFISISNCYITVT